MKKLDAAGAFLLGGFLVLTLGAQDAAPTPAGPTAVVGTFDSRAVLLAYVGSDAFQDYVSAQQEDVGRALERAREAGDDALAAELDALGPAMQRRIHRQGFGTAPVDDVIARIEDELPAIAEKAGVDLIVSKWALAYRSPTAEVVDVTDLLAAEFDPDENTLRSIREIMAQEPVPLDQLGDDH